jgi:uncharacterized protein YdeI (BOF family)
MKRRTLMLAACALLFVSHAIAQSKADADPLTGTWSGTMGPSETRQQPIKVELKYDGKSITGTITGPNRPADIQSGTFDSSTGALRMEAAIRDDAKTPVVLEGKLVKGTASGSISFNNNTGTFTITKDAPAK